MSPPIISPFDGTTVLPDSDFSNNTATSYFPSKWNVDEHDLGVLYFSSSIELKFAFVTPEDRKAWLLIRSKLWRAFHDGSGDVLGLCLDYEYSDILRQVGDAKWSHLQLLSFEQEIERAKSLTFTQKCLETLMNIYTLRNQYTTFQIPYRLGILNAYGDSQTDVQPENGMAYGASEQEALLTYEYLHDSGFIKKVGEIPGYTQTFAITAKGYIEIDKIQRGHEANLSEGFFIRPWSPHKDEYFRDVLNAIRERTGCNITAVWDTHHNERIDERIFRRIKECAVVLLDIAKDRFNVGFEAGYALALEKQIVVIREGTQDSLPFDIATLNCYDYDLGNKEALIDVLSERVRVALETAKSSNR